MAADVSIGINVIWDNQKQMQKAKDELLALGKTALLSADDFGTTGAEINKSFSAMLPYIKTSSQALKVFTTEGYLAWVNYQKEVDEASKGIVKSSSNLVKNLQPGFDRLAKMPGTSEDAMKSYLLTMANAQKTMAKIAENNKKISSTFSASGFLSTVNKQKKATAEWGNEVLALSQAMDTIAKKGATLEFANSNGKQTENIKKLRTEYENLQTQLNTINTTKFNKSMQTQYSYTEATKGVIEALREKYKTLDTAIKGMISSGDISELESYKKQLLSVKSTITKLQTASERFNKEGFFSSLDKNSEAIEAMDGRLAAVNARMKMLRTTILKVTEAGNANENEVKELREEYAKLSTEQVKLQKESNGTKKRITNLIKSFVSAQAIVWLVRSTFMKLVNTLKEASEVAAAAEETMNLFEVVFDGVNDSAEEMANTMAKSFGVAQSSIAQGLSTLGDFAEGLGMSNQAALDFSNTLSSRMLDVISFKNVAGDTTDILKNLSSGLAGNTENFRTWGVVIKESSVKLWLAENNMDKLTGTALELAKVQARAALFMEQTTNAAGDMARTFDSTVNIARRLTEANKQLNENMGVGINEIVTPVKKNLLKIVESWNLASEAKKAYADIDPFENEKQQVEDTSNQKRMVAFLRQLYENTAPITGASGATGSAGGAYISGSSIVSGINQQGMSAKEFTWLVDNMNTDIDTVIKTMNDLNLAYDEELLTLLEQKKIEEEYAKERAKTKEALIDFGDTLELWSSSGNGSIFSSVTESLQNLVSPFETATGTESSTSELATAYQSELKTMFEESYNTMIQAQSTGNEWLEKSAKSTMDIIVQKYNDTQALIDEESRIAELDKENAEAFKDAVQAFQDSMDAINENINKMTSNVEGLMRNTGVSASMLGADSSMVSIAQNRATALLGVKAQNLAARQKFAAEKGKSLEDFLPEEHTGKTTEIDISNLPSMEDIAEFKNLIKGQKENLKTTNTYYDLLEANAKVQLGYSDAENDISAQNIANYQALADITLKQLQIKVDEGKVTQQYYDDEKKILDGHISTLKELNFKKIKDIMSGLSSISTTESVSIGGTGIFSGATTTYKENMAKLDEITEAVWKTSEDGISKDDAQMLNDSLISIKEAYELDKTQAYLDATGISSSPDLELITNLGKILQDVPSAFNTLMKDLGGELNKLLEKINLDELFDKIGGGISSAFESSSGFFKDTFGGIFEGIGDLFYQGDENGEGAGPLAGVMGLFGDLGAVLGPIVEALIYIFSQTESFQDIMSILTDALDGLVPIIDSFLAPLMLVLEPLITLLEHILMPILVVLFPIIKAIMYVLLPLIAVIDVVIIYMGMLQGVIKDIVTFNWRHIDDNFKDAGDKIVDTWKNLGDDLAELNEMTLDTTSDLKRANSDYIDAIDDMMGKGLLTGQEALEMVAKKAGSSYTGTDYQYIGKDSYSRGAGTVNIGKVTIDAQGKTMEEVIEELQQLSREKSITGGTAS